MQEGEFNRFLLHLRRAEGISRRYFITNGFDGALTMLGLMVGFALSDNVALSVAIKACFGAAVALCVSGMSSAYLSELAERKKELQELEKALIVDLSQSDYGKASRFVPVVVAMVNGLTPLLISLFIVTPLWLAENGVHLAASPFLTAILVAFLLIFGMGVMLGKLTREFWLWNGLRMLLVAMATVLIIFAVSG